MKRFLFVMSLATVLTIAGCGNDDGNDETGGQNDTEENQNESSKNDNKDQENESQGEDNEKATQSALLDTQMSLVQELRPHNKKIVAVQSDLKTLSETKEEKEKEKLKTSIKEGATEGQKAADEAMKAIDSFEPSSELPDEMKSKVNEALKDLKAYFKESKSTLDTPLEADFSKADEQFKAFEDKIGSLYEEVGLNAPNLGDEMK